MPNIELHGFVEATDFGQKPHRPSGPSIYDVKKKIWNLIKNEGFSDDTVISIVVDIVKDSKENKQPFIRVVSTPHDYIPRLLELLQELDVDIELQELKAFYKKKSAG